MSIGTHELGAFEIGAAPSPFVPSASPPPPPPPAPAPEPAPAPAERTYVFRPMTARLISPLPTPPSRRSPADFNNRADAFNDALQRLADELNAATPGDSAAGLAQYLASFDADKGPALLKLAGLAAYAPGTVGARLAQTMSPTDYPWLAAGDGTTNDTQALADFFAAVPDGAVVDLGGRTFRVHVGVAGTTSGDAVALNRVPRLAARTRVTIRNGTIEADSPGVSATKRRFPCTLVIDGCTNVTLQNLTLRAKGESYGDSDASVSLGVEARRTFCAQNGGHALLVVRSRNVKGTNARTERCGSTAPFYFMSCADVELNDCYSSAMSLGYSAYAFDSWAGGTAVTGFTRHDAVLNNCRTDANGATYGSKGGVVAEDGDVFVRVNGGVWKDAYANGASTFIGYAFCAVDATMHVHGAQVENCASIGCTYNSGSGTSELEVYNTIGKWLRTAGHINADNSFGTGRVKYQNCRFEIVSTSLWAGVPGLSTSSVVANLKRASTLTVDLLNCVAIGGQYLAWNPYACYGGLRIVGGHYEVYEQLLLSAGWGGSAAGSGRGFEMMAGAKVLLTNAASITPCISTTNHDSGTGVSTFQYIDIDDSCTIEALTLGRAAESIADNSAGARVERKRLRAALIGCVTLIPRNSLTASMRVISLDGVFGSNYRITVAFANGVPALGLTFDNASAPRSVLSFQSLAGTGGELRAQVNISGTGATFTVGSSYPVVAA